MDRKPSPLPTTVQEALEVGAATVATQRILRWIGRGLITGTVVAIAVGAAPVIGYGLLLGSVASVGAGRLIGFLGESAVNAQPHHRERARRLLAETCAAMGIEPPELVVLSTHPRRPRLELRSVAVAGRAWPVPRVQMQRRPLMNAAAVQMPKLPWHRAAMSPKVVITTPILDRLNDEQMCGVIAHELNHLRRHHSQKRLATLPVQFLLSKYRGLLLFTAAVGAGFSLPAFVATSVAVVVLREIRMHRQRAWEMEADLDTARHTPFGPGLASALAELRPEHTGPPTLMRRILHLLVPPFNSHPLVSGRIAAIGRVTAERDQRLRSTAPHAPQPTGVDLLGTPGLQTAVPTPATSPPRLPLRMTHPMPRPPSSAGHDLD